MNEVLKIHYIHLYKHSLNRLWSPDFARRSFSYCAPTIWSKLPTADNLLGEGKPSFKSR